jgi:PD-(D/E)XK endonuclease
MEHTKWKGDRSTLAIILGLTGAGFDVAVPFGENTRYDLIADEGERLLRVQCKSGRLRNGVIHFATCSTYAHHPNPKVTRRDYHGEIDAFAVYCMSENVRFASDYEIAQVELVATARPRGSSGAG